ncbi:MAG: amidase [Planctomycetota bacterium]|nr:amidase [Planctomycetota bacterium]
MFTRALLSCIAVFLVGAVCGCQAPSTKVSYQVEEKTVAELSADMASGAVTSESLVRLYLHRIEILDRAGPKIGSVLAVNPRALEDARRLDTERAGGQLRGALHGVPVLLKDNIESADPLPTTAGSLALAENLTRRDAPIVARLRAAGAIILGKSNLSEWANMRANGSTSGWSALGGLTRNPYSLDCSACGSSSGSGAAVAANLTALAVGTETDGSVTCPGAMNGIVGLKPTVGLLSRRHIIPISHTQDTAGPMTRTVADAAAMLTVMAGTDSLDPATAEADQRRTDYVAALDARSLKGARLGVLRPRKGAYGDAAAEVFEKALSHLKEAGAELVELQQPPQRGRIGRNEMIVLLYEFKAGLNAYLADTAAAVKTRTLAAVIEFNKREADRELQHFGQQLFIQAEATDGLESPVYRKALEENRRLAGPEGIDRLLGEHRIDALIAPSTGRAFKIDFKNGDRFQGGQMGLAAVSGYPHLTVPMGLADGLPVGLSFIGTAWSEARLLSLGYAFEKKANARRKPKYNKGD